MRNAVWRPHKLKLGLQLASFVETFVASFVELWHTPVMNVTGELTALHYATRQPVCVRWRDGLITQVQPASSHSREELWIAPTLFDVQINGYGGVDFQQDELELEELLQATRALRAGGCGRFLVTLITDEWSRLTARLRHFRALRAQSAELQSAIVGWHVEGPFLSAAPGFHGAHNPARMIDPSPEHILELRTITGAEPLLLTLAPERRGALQAIALAKARGAVVSLGHTNGSAEVLLSAVEAGASCFTHLGNGCPRELDRHDNILWRVFETPGLSVSLIPDQIHVSPTLFRLVHRVLGPESVFFITDAMSAAGMPPGRYKLAKMELEVGADQVVRQPGKALFAGSALRPIDGVMRAARMLGCDWQETWSRFSELPAKVLRLKNSLEVGQPADFCLLKAIGKTELLLQNPDVCSGARPSSGAAMSEAKRS